MENASKALVIAGTIIIVMLLIAAGMYVFNKAQGVNSSMKSNLSNEQKQTFNQRFQAYQGEQSGARVRELIVAVNKSNSENEDVLRVDFNKLNFVSKDTAGTYYPNSKLINNKTYKVILGLQDGVVHTITIEEY